ncbi:MAG: hypothetical protein K6B44_08050 [Lachnospiraceae bacterium]|nr:hypothetical protein [Lachnospiraceae bacterium]
MREEKNDNSWIWALLIAATLMIGALLLGNDMLFVLKWYAALLLGTIVFYPVAAHLFAGFKDVPWFFAKVCGLMIPGYVMWVCASARLLKFGNAACIAVFVFCAILVYLLPYAAGRKTPAALYKGADINRILKRELLFAAALTGYVYIRAFSPDAFGTERMMDYSFMQSMYESSYFPPADVWFAGQPLNYYYFGQYIFTYLSKLSFNTIDVSYNLSLGSCFAICLCLAYSIGFALMEKKGKAKAAAGTIGAMALMFAANMHFFIFYKLVPMFREILGIGGEYKAYWYPDSTRYIGYNPDVADKTAHEYPAYSFILGDLHAHVINVFVVLSILGLVLSYLKRREKYAENKGGMKQVLIDRCVFAVGFLIGICAMENAWDFPIYFVVAGAVILYANIISLKSAKDVILATLIQGGIVLAVSMLVSLPFNLGFEAMVNGIEKCTEHSRFYQLVILWGMPVILLISFILVLRRRLTEAESKKEQTVIPFKLISSEDIFTVLIGLCALGLVIIPELIYVEDIYSGSFKRFNTMFKLTYQSFILFAVMQAHIISCYLCKAERPGQRKGGIAALVLLILCCMYFPVAVKMGIGTVGPKGELKGIAADGYVYEQCPMDALAIEWIKTETEKGSVILEANGDSYTIYNRVSTLSGRPTVLGWRTHEWLWQNDSEVVDERDDDVWDIYCGTDPAKIRELCSKYSVDYIFIGSCEYEKYLPDGMDAELLKSLGEVVYDGGGIEPVYIIKL